MLYLLHFDQKIGRAQHYLGCCHEHRLDARLTEHARGRGARLTSACVERKIPIYLARVFPLISFDQEAKLKRSVSFKELCPLCCPLLASLKSATYQLDADRPEQPPPRAVWDWRSPLPDYHQNP